MSPRTIMTSKTIDYSTHFVNTSFGQYIQTHEKHDNTMQTRTVGAIVLRPTGNVQGGHFYLSLATGYRLNHIHATPLLMPQEVINRVYSLARNNHKGLKFRNRSNEIIEDDPISDNTPTIGNNYYSILDDVDDNHAPLDTIPNGPVHTDPLSCSPFAGVNDDKK